MDVFILFRPIAWGKWVFSFCFVQLPEANACFHFVLLICLKQMGIFVLFHQIAWGKWTFSFCFIQLPEAFVCFIFNRPIAWGFQVVFSLGVVCAIHRGPHISGSPNSSSCRWQEGRGEEFSSLRSAVPVPANCLRLIIDNWSGAPCYLSGYHLCYWGALLHGLSLLLHLLYTTPRVPRNLAVMNF